MGFLSTAARPADCHLGLEGKWRCSVNLGVFEGAEALEEEEEALGAQEESTVEPEEITTSIISLERFAQPDSQVVSWAFLP